MSNVRNENRMIAFGVSLRKFRKAKKWSMEKLALEADIDFSQVHRIEIGKGNPTLATILLLADALQIKASELLDFKE